MQPVLAETEILTDITAKNRQTKFYSMSAKDLLAQDNTPVVKVTGIKVQQTNKGLEIVLQTLTGQRLVPLILPEGNNLVIDLLDARLNLSAGNNFRVDNPAPGIKAIIATQVHESNIRLTVRGKNNTPSAEIVPNQQNLVLSITPERVTTEKTPDQEIEVIATGEGEDDDYFVPDAEGATKEIQSFTTKTLELVYLDKD